MSDGLVRSGRFLGVNWTLAGIFGLLLIIAVSIVPLTLTILQSRESDALVIDMAGRQRMLLERHMKEVLLATDGVNAPYEQTRDRLRERLIALIGGGTIVARVVQEERVALPSAPTDRIREKLLEQQRLLEAFFAKADRLLNTPKNAASYGTTRDGVLNDNAVLLEVANDAVAMLTQHSEARVRTLIRWELIVVLLVVAVASVGTWRFVQAENALKRSQAMTIQAFQQSDTVKSSLLSSVSHELRTPLTAVKTMLFSLQEDGDSQLSPMRKEFLKGIDQELDYLNRLVENLLDMSRLEAGMLMPRREWHVLDELVEGAIRRVEVLLARRPLHVRLAQGLPPIYVDGVQIQQVLVNLLDNAIKFSPPESPIRITALLAAETLEVRVSNSGDGIPSDELNRIFDRFYRVQSGRSYGTPGAGLGLAICKGIVEAHGGHIMAQSVPGEETTILFRLPLTTSVPARDGVASEPHPVEAVS
ncbi:MAG: type IV pili methyl-accepting chemotaxis transducer N-terminal domain-containing protein [Nitrospirae bacterium]|nr:type IV pili methyl-accepting chemotaxis transducer N-terminal domain-containing protein [Nitrospirota bacterium]MDE3039349.1 type IV pili methyl-accepting chemotaxis transducer N-terminal domain-containing protein [Nitrospirota bacterium]